MKLRSLCFVGFALLVHVAVAEDTPPPPPPADAAAAAPAPPAGGDAGAPAPAPPAGGDAGAPAPATGAGGAAAGGGAAGGAAKLADDDDDDLLDDYEDEGDEGDEGDKDDDVPAELRKEIEAKESEHTLEQKIKWDVVLVANLANKSKSDGDTYTSKLKHIQINVEFDPVSPSLSRVSMEDKKKEPSLIRSGINGKGRGMELSEVVDFQGKLVSCDEATGILYIIPTRPPKSKKGGNKTSEIEPRPWVTLWDGDGTHTKGFACKWMTEKDGALYVGGNGKLSVGENNSTITDALYIKRVSPNGEISHVNWMNKYTKIAAYSGVWHPGYVTHEAVGWSPILGSWVFLPKKISRDAFDAAKDAEKGANSMLVTDEGFKRFTPIRIGQLNPGSGFSSFKWVPGTEDQVVVALKTESKGEAVTTYVTAFDMAGAILLPETKVADESFEGIAFLKQRLSDSDRRALKKWKTNRRKKPSHKYNDERVYDYGMY